MNVTLHTLLLVALPFALVGCCCGLGDTDAKHTTLAELDEPVPARLIYKKRAKAWDEDIPFRTPKDHDRFYLEVSEPQKLTVSLPKAKFNSKTKLEFTSDKAGERLAYRTKGQDWRVVYVEQESLIWSSSLRKKLKWSKVPSFLKAAPALFSEHSKTPILRQHIISEVRANRGEDGVGELLLATIGAENDRLSVWDKTFEKLTGHARQAIMKELTASWSNSKGKLTFKQSRALRYIDLSATSLSASFVQAIEASLQAKEPSAKDVALLLRGLYAQEHPQAGKLACRAIGRSRVKKKGKVIYPNTYAPMLESAFLVLAATRTRCDHALAFVKNSPCHHDIINRIGKDDNSLRTPKELGAFVKESLKRNPVIRAHRQPSSRPLYRFGLAAVVAVDGENPDFVVLAHARRFYDVKQDASRTKCKKIKDAGQPCSARELTVRKNACQMDAQSSEYAGKHMTFRVNDDKKKISNLRSAGR